MQTQAREGGIERECERMREGMEGERRGEGRGEVILVQGCVKVLVRHKRLKTGQGNVVHSLAGWTIQLNTGRLNDYTNTTMEGRMVDL